VLVKRFLEDNIQTRLLKDKKAIVILGPKQTGKTTLLHHLFDGMDNVVERR